MAVGTKEFVTALQLDTKLDGIPSPGSAGARRPGRARIAILEVMAGPSTPTMMSRSHPGSPRSRCQ